jgi:hypothetical protein
MGGPTSSKCYRQHSSQDHLTTQAPPPRQSRGTFGGDVHHQEDCIVNAALYGMFFMRLCKQSSGLKDKHKMYKINFKKCIMLVNIT